MTRQLAAWLKVVVRRAADAMSTHQSASLQLPGIRRIVCRYSNYSRPVCVCRVRRKFVISVGREMAAEVSISKE